MARTFNLGLCLLAASSLASAQVTNIPTSIEQAIISIFPTAANPSMYLDSHSSAAASFENAFSSIIVANPTYFPSIASAFDATGLPTGGNIPSSAGGGGGGIPTTDGGAVFGSTTAGGGGGGGLPTQLATGASGGSQGASATPSPADPNFGVAMQTPALGLGLTGAIVAGVAGAAAFL